MSAIITERSRIYGAKAFLNSLGNPTSSTNNYLFVFIGHTLPWSDNDAPGATDTFPPSPTDTIASSNLVWANMMHLKQINASDCSLVILNYEWEENVIYTQYDQDIDLFDPTEGQTPFYVLTTDFNVYKCLYNNNGGPSYVEPTGISTNIIHTGDGYYWKYMFTVNTASQQNFLTDQWIPIYTLLVSDNSNQWDVQQSAINGSIDIIQVETKGSGYIVAPAVSISGDGTGAVGVANIASGSVISITMTNPGKNYTFATATVTSGQVTLITITNQGTGYSSTPAVDISGDGTGALAHAVLLNGSVIQIVIDNPGSNYTTATVTIASGPGIQALATATVSGGVTLKPIIPPPGGHGSDPVTELGAFYALVSSNLQFQEGGLFTIVNDFRTLGVVANPLQWNSTEPATGTLYSQAWVLPLVSVSGTFEPDDLVQGLTSGATGVTLDYGANGNGLLRVVNVIGEFIPGETIQNNSRSGGGLLQLSTGTAQSGGAFQITLAAGDAGTTEQYVGATLRIVSGPGAGQIRIITEYNSTSKLATLATNWVVTPTSSSTYSIAQITYPGLQPNTGELLYIENIRPVTRSSAQTESIRPVFEF